MNPETICLIQESYALLAPDALLLVDLFYARLFQLDPTLRDFFPNDFEAHKRKLLALLAQVVTHLDAPEVWTGAVLESGRRHRARGVTARDYDTFGSAFIWTLEKGLGELFTFQVLGAWVALYGMLATLMQSAPETSFYRAPIPPGATNLSPS